ncbi:MULTISPECIES: hypothetical protein [Paraliobacillus]|uniref:hypothetical protein n=1 Tax=Paraliobacillus TaxID=200903 RepID=UPI000DD3354E|nr:MULTISPECIES: hypothetical protein [Paraliobacillus]
MKSSNFGIHEIVDLRELINFKVGCLSQSKSRMKIVENIELKTLVEQSVKQGHTAVNQMKDLLTSASTQINQ